MPQPVLPPLHLSQPPARLPDRELSDSGCDLFSPVPDLLVIQVAQ